MAIQTHAPDQLYSQLWKLRRPFTVHDYHRMLEVGILREDDRLELLEGEVVEMSPINPRHAASVKRLIRLFTSRLGDRALVDVQNPVQLDEHSEPQPDLALLEPRPDYYAQSHPTPAEVRLLVEVVDTTLDYDREVKAPVYARAAIPELWLVNLVDGWLEVYREPSPVGYRSIRRVLPGEHVAPLAFPDVTLAADELLLAPAS
jgi:hypothetical protein